jgi:hypothetical protein
MARRSPGVTDRRSGRVTGAITLRKHPYLKAATLQKTGCAMLATEQCCKSASSGKKILTKSIYCILLDYFFAKKQTCSLVTVSAKDGDRPKRAPRKGSDKTMKILKKQIQMTFLAFAIAAGTMLGSVQQCKATTDYYNDYYNYYQYYTGYYNATGNTSYYYRSIAYYYYWVGSYYGDYYGYNSNSLGSKSPTYNGNNSYWDSYYNYYAYYGDYYYRL